MQKLICLMVLFLTGCTTYFKVDPTKDIANYTPDSTRAFLHRSIETGYLGTAGCGKTYKSTWWVTSDRIIVDCPAPNIGYREYKYADFPDLVARIRGGGGPHHYGCVQLNAQAPGCLFYWEGEGSHQWAMETTKAWYVQARKPKSDPAEEIKFAAEASMYVNTSPKPTIPESVMRFKVQAEHAIKEKRFYDAAEAYRQALLIAPWWSAGQYNYALIQSELRDYNMAIQGFRRFLKLEPDSPNGRAIQNRIYELEALAAK